MDNIFSILCGVLFVLLLYNKPNIHGPNSKDMIDKEFFVNGVKHKWGVKRLNHPFQ